MGDGQATTKHTWTTDASRRLRTLSGDHLRRVGEKDEPGEGRGSVGTYTPPMLSPGSSDDAPEGLR